MNAIIFFDGLKLIGLGVTIILLIVGFIWAKIETKKKK